MLNDLQGKAVLITGGTRGIGLATGLAFGRLGADVTLTHRWGSANEDAIRAAFRDAGASEPDIVEADVSQDAEMDAVYARIASRHDHLEVFVPNVALAPVVKELGDYNRRGLLRGIEYTAWPLAAGIIRIHEVFGAYPRYVVGMSSGGPDAYHAHYDFAAAAKAVLEVLARYLSQRLFDEECRINVVRARWVDTASFRSTFGDDFVSFVDEQPLAHPWVTCDEVADAAVALCSGLMDGVRGQILTLDHGEGFHGNLMGMYAETQR